MFDVSLVPTFVAVAKVRHFGKAAELLNATQPGVSQHISKLERQLGIKLLDRTKRSVQLTEAGQVFLDHAKRLIPMLQRMEDDSRKMAEGLMGKVALGFSSSIVFSDIPERISRFAKDRPEIELQYRVQGGDELKALLDWGDIDAIVMTLPAITPEYWSVPVSQQPMGVAIQAKHSLARRRRLTLEALRDEPFVVVPRDQHPRNHDVLIARFHAMGATLKVSAYDTSFPNVLARVAMGEGVALVALGYRGEQSDSVRVIPLDDALLAETPIYAIARHDNLKKATKQLIESLGAR